MCMCVFQCLLCVIGVLGLANIGRSCIITRLVADSLGVYSTLSIVQYRTVVIAGSEK